MTPRPAPLALAAIVLAVVGLVAAAIGLAASDDDGDVGTSGAPPSVEEAVADAEDFVSGVRNLDFKRPVRITLLDGDRFRDRLLDEADEDRPDIQVDERIFRALGLIEKDVDLYDVVLRFFGAAVVGFYDPEANELVLRGRSLTPYVRATLAHELTHALDDQWFDLHRPELLEGPDDEAALAFQALVEGNAVRVEEAFRARMSETERRQAAAEQVRLAGGIDLSDIPPMTRNLLTELIAFPYREGPKFVQALLEAGGERRVDDAFRVPPTTSEDIADAAGWLTGRRAAEVDRPEAGGEVIDKGVFGLQGLAVTLAPVVGTAEAGRAAVGWGGDQYVAWDAADGKTCVRATFVMDTARDLEEVTASLRTWAVERGATVDRGAERVTFTACG